MSYAMKVASSKTHTHKQTDVQHMQQQLQYKKKKSLDRRPQKARRKRRRQRRCSAAYKKNGIHKKIHRSHTHTSTFSHTHTQNMYKKRINEN